MDTSDSECFESADEEIYPEEDRTFKTCELPNETQKALENLNIVHSPLKSQDFEKLGNSDTLDCEVLNANLKPMQQESCKTDGTPRIDEEIKVDNTLFNEEILKRNKTENEDLQINLANDSKNKNITLSTQCKTDSLITDKETSQTISDESEHLLPVETNKNNSEFSSSENTNNVNKETSDLMLDNDNKKPIRADIQEVSDSEENMWENDDWEPISYEKDIKVSDNQEKECTELKSKEKMEEKVEENMWDNDDWESFEKVEPEKPDQSSEPTWSGWGNWGGMSSIFTTATQGVTTLTNQVSQGLTTVLETSMGIPDPTQLAKLDREKEILVEEHHEESANKTNLGFGFGNLSNLVSGVSHITKFVENTSNKVITGGLDTLETIGKKTMEVLQEGDPGLKNKRALLKLDKEKPILSQVLREAKEKAERENKVLQEQHSKKKMNYETLFDDYHGLVHLEALEMLSKQCDIKLQTLSENCSGTEFQELRETMDQIKELCEIPDEDDEDTPTFDDIKEKIQVAVKEINVSITYDKLVSIWEDTEVWLSNLKLDFCDEDEIHQEALQVLAQLTAIAVEQFHKCGELLLIKEHRSTADEADSLVQLTLTLTSLIGLVAGKFSEKLNMKSSQSGNKESINSLITNVFFEAGNSSSYLQDAFQLLIPVLQVGAV